MVTHHVVYAEDLGFSETYASSVLSLFGIMFAIGSLGSLISDRIGREITVLIAGMACISGLLVFLFMNDTSQPWMLYYYAISVGFGFGLSCPTIIAAATDIFQGPKVGAALGFIWFTFAIGGAIGPWIGGWIFELTGQYLAAFILAIAMVMVACASIWIAGARKVRRVPGWRRREPPL